MSSWSQTVEESWKSIRDKYHDSWSRNERKYKDFVVNVDETYELPDGSSLFPGGKAKTGIVFSTIRSMIPRISTRDAWISVKLDSPGDATIDWEVYEIAVNKSLRMIEAGTEIKKAQLDTLLTGTGFVRLNAPTLDDYLYPEDAIEDGGGNLERALPGPGNDAMIPVSKSEVERAGDLSQVGFGIVPEDYIRSKPKNYLQTLPKLTRVSPFHVVWPKNCTSFDTAAWVAHIFPVTKADLKRDRRYSNRAVNALPTGDAENSPAFGADSSKVTQTFDRSRGDKILYKAEIFIRHDPKETGKSGKILHVVLGTDTILYEIENPYKDKVIPIFQMQFNPLNDSVVGVSEVDAISHDATRLAALEQAMFRNFARFHAQKVLVGNGATITEPEERKLIDDEAGTVVRIDGSIEQVKFSPHLQIPQDWMLYREQLRRNAHESAGLDAFQRGSAVKDISASQSAIIDKSSTARIEEKHAEIQKFFRKILVPYGDLLTSFVEDIFIDVRGEYVDMTQYKDFSFLYSIDPMSLKPSSSTDEIVQKIQFLKVASQVPQMAEMIDWKAMLKHLAYSMGVPVDIVKQAVQAEPDQAELNLQQIQQNQFDPGDRAENAGAPGNNSNPLSAALSAANGLR